MLKNSIKKLLNSIVVALSNKKLFKKILKIFTLSSATAMTVTSQVQGGAIQQNASGSSVTNYNANTDTVTFTAATALTTAGGADVAASFVTTSGTSTVWSVAGTNKLTITGAVTTTANDTLIVNLSGGAVIDVAEAWVEGNTAALSAISVTLAGTSSLIVSDDDTHVWDVDGATANLGTIAATGDTVFSGTMGGTNGLAVLIIATSKTSTFQEDSKIGALGAVGSLVVNKDMLTSTIIADGNVLVNNGAAASSITGAIAESAGTDTTVLSVVKGADAAASIVTFGGAIDMDNVQVGSANQAGSMVAEGIVTGAVTVDGGNVGTEISTFSTSANVIGNIVLDENSGGAAILTTTGSSAVTLTGTIAAGTAGEGDINFNNTGGTTVTGIVGGTNVGTLTVAATASATFNDNAIVSAIVANGTTTFKQSVTSTTLKSSGTLNVTNAAAETIAGAITENLAADTTALVVVNSADAEGTLATFSGAVTLDTVTVGNATKGAEAKFQSAVITTTMTVVGGNEGDEDNLLNMNDADLTAATVLTAATAGATATLQSTGTSAMIVTGAITQTTAAGGVLDIDNTATTTVTGAIGTSSQAISAMDIADGADLIAQGDVFITSAVLNGAGIFKVDGTGAKTVTSVITAGADDQGDVLLSNTSGLTTFTGAIGVRDTVLNEISVEDANSVYFTNAVAAATFDIDGGEVTFNAASNLVGEADTSGSVDLAGAPTINLTTSIGDGDTLFVADEAAAADAFTVSSDGATIKLPTNFTSGTITLLSQATVATKGAIGTENLDAEAALLTANDTALYDYTIAASGTGSINIEATVVEKSDVAKAATMASTLNQAKAMVAANTAASGEDAILQIFNNALTSINSLGDADVKALAQQVTPQTDSQQGSLSSTKSETGTLQGIMSNRMASLRSGDAYVSGISTGNSMSANSAFIQIFGSEAEQDNRNKDSGVNYGFDSETEGVAIGFDGMTESGSIVGLSFAVGETTVTGKGSGQSTNKIDSYSASVYMDMATDMGYVEGSFTLGIADNNNSRKISTSGITRTYKGAYDSHSMSLKIGAGSPQDMGGGTYVTPYGSLTGTIMETDTYTESSTSATDPLRLQVSQDEVNSIVGSVGIKAHKVTDRGTPMISLAINGELGDDVINTTNTYSGGGSAFQTTSEVEQMSATLGLGYTLGSDALSIDIGYEAEANDDEYLSHYGSVKLTGKF
jgi:hypothetical protein